MLSTQSRTSWSRRNLREELSNQCPDTCGPLGTAPLTLFHGLKDIVVVKVLQFHVPVQHLHVSPSVKGTHVHTSTTLVLRRCYTRLCKPSCMSCATTWRLSYSLPRRHRSKTSSIPLNQHPSKSPVPAWLAL